MRQLLTVIILTALHAGGCLGQQYSPQFDKCMDKAITQTAMTFCAGEEAKRADAELNQVYQKALSAVRGELSSTEKIRASQRAWIVFRDAYIEAMYPAKDKQLAYGSMFSMEVNLVRARLTQQQVVALNELLKQFAEVK